LIDSFIDNTSSRCF